MKKTHNQFKATASRAALFLLMPLMLISCKSRNQKITEATQDIIRINAEMDSIANMQQKDIQDSVSKNIVYMFLNKYIAEDAARIDSLKTRNYTMIDSLQTQKINHTAKQYPLNKLLSQQEIEAISNQLKEFCNEWNEDSADNIIAGRGSLLDLYNVCFDLDYSLFNPSFHIIDDNGTIRFDDWRDRICIEFEKQKKQFEEDEILRTMRNRANQMEHARNQIEIAEFDRKCAASDSVYMEVEKYFQNKYKPKLDTLAATKDRLTEYRAALIRERQLNHK